MLFAINIWKPKDNGGYGARHLTIDLEKTLCGIKIGFTWVEVNHEEVNCCHCLDYIPAGLKVRASTQVVSVI